MKPRKPKIISFYFQKTRHKVPNTAYTFFNKCHILGGYNQEGFFRRFITGFYLFGYNFEIVIRFNRKGNHFGLWE